MTNTFPVGIIDDAGAAPAAGSERHRCSLLGKVMAKCAPYIFRLENLFGCDVSSRGERRALKVTKRRKNWRGVNLDTPPKTSIDRGVKFHCLNRKQIYYAFTVEICLQQQSRFAALIQYKTTDWTVQMQLFYCSLRFVSGQSLGVETSRETIRNAF